MNPNELYLAAKSVDFLYRFDSAEAEYEARCEAEQDGALRVCRVCDHPHADEELTPEGECPFAVERDMMTFHPCR